MPKGNERDKQAVDLDDIKRLLILLLLKSGATSDEIGRAIGLDSSTVRHMVSARKSSANK